MKNVFMALFAFFSLGIAYPALADHTPTCAGHEGEECCKGEGCDKEGCARCEKGCEHCYGQGCQHHAKKDAAPKK